MAQYNIFYMGYSDAEALLRSLLKDHLQFLSLLKSSGDAKPEIKIEGKVLESIDQSKLNLDKLYPAGEEGMYSVRGTPLYKLHETLMLFAEIHAFK